jgi:hypothetical protein
MFTAYKMPNDFWKGELAIEGEHPHELFCNGDVPKAE